MSGDLEDFLKRAAQRRQAKAAQQKNSPKRVPPQYSDSRTERIPQPVPEDEIVEAQVVSATYDEDVVVADAVTTSQPRRPKRQRTSQPRSGKSSASSSKTLSDREQSRVGTSVEVQPADTSYTQGKKSLNQPAMTGFSAEALIEMLKRPGGVQQALLLREILDRPEHRW